MKGRSHALLLATMALCGPLSFSQNAGPARAAPAAPATSTVPDYTSDGLLNFPANYREWIYLTSGFDMSYNPNAQPGRHVFDNVFVNPEAYRAFMQTGRWPDGTMMVLEVRGAQDRGSINRSGNYQEQVTGLEVHVKDGARFSGQWGFFGFDSRKPAKMIAPSADCYSCHAEHAAVDTTFVQFYPTLMPVARDKRTLSAAYLRETAAESAGSTR